ncbi:hypothetical protein HKX48_008330 [Thoreauomyces humboldtii]|nr:hypothetical protein HKX48_008330 [Thoreauomyces humboldtii]
MADPMDVSLDDLISSSRKPGGGANNRRNGGGRATTQRDPRGGGAERNSNSNHRRNDSPYTRGNADGDWSHDMFGGSRSSGGSNASKPGLRSASAQAADSEASTQIKIDNLHWNVSEQDVRELMSAHGAVQSVRLKFDNAGRSDGVCYVTFNARRSAQAAVDAYDGRDLDGMTMHVALVERNNRRANNGGGTGLASRLGPKPAGSVLDRLGQKLTDRLGPRPAGNDALVAGLADNGGRRNGGGDAGKSHQRQTSHTRAGADSRGSSNRKPAGASLQDLDAQMDRYMSGKPEPEPAPARGPSERAIVDWDRPTDTIIREVIAYDDLDQTPAH